MDRRKVAAALVIALLAVAAPAGAKTRYVNDINKITVRSGQGVDYKILGTISSGETVDTLTEGPEWTLVRIADGREGWVLTRLLTDNKPCSVLLKQLQQEVEARSPPDGVPKEIKRLQAENEHLTTALADEQARSQTAVASYEALRNESGQVLDLQAEKTRLTSALQQANQRIDAVTGEINRLENRHLFRWFLSGAGVLLLGVVLGYSGRVKRRRSSLL